MRPYATIEEAAHAGEGAVRGDGTPVVPALELSASAAYGSLAALDQALAGREPLGDDPYAGFHYARHGHPTARVLERAVADLEGTEDALAAASGMAALHLVVDTLAAPDAGSTIVASVDLYGATTALLQARAKAGTRVVQERLADTRAAVLAIERERPALTLVETIGNPLLRVADIQFLADAVHAVGGRLVVDNTFASPVLLRPAALGADLVVESATKYLGGHGDVTAGVVAGPRELVEELRRAQRLKGSVLGAFEAYLVLRGLRTLGLRMARQMATAATLAGRADRLPGVRRVLYPGRADHPDAAVVARQFGDRGAGAVLTLELEGGRARAWQVLERLRVFRAAPTLGDLTSLALHPASASHRGLTPDERARLGVTEGMIRLSVGIEDPDTLWQDLAFACT